MPDIHEALAAVTAAREVLAKFADELPNLDANAMVYSVTISTVEKLDIFLKDLPPTMEEAKRLAEKYPDLMGKTR